MTKWDLFYECKTSLVFVISPIQHCSHLLCVVLGKIYKYTTFLYVMADILHTRYFIQLLTKSVKRKEGEEI